MYTNWLGFYKWILGEPRVPGAPRERETRVSFTYEYFTPSQGSANRSASGRVLGAMTCHGSASFGQSRLYCIPPLHLTGSFVDSPLFTTPTSAAYHPV